MTVELWYREGLGNNLFQYVFARLLAEDLGRELVCRSRPGARGLPASAFADAPQRLAGEVVIEPELRLVLPERPLWDGHGLDLGWIHRHAPGRRIVLDGYFQRASYYAPHRARIRRWLAPAEPPRAPPPEPDEVIVHVRRGDYQRVDSALSMSFYERVLGSMSHRRVHVTGRGIDRTTRASLSRFDPIWVDLGELPSLHHIARFDRIVLSNSTFAWWAAFLSDASRIWMPRPCTGYWSAETTRIALAMDDPRYVLVDDVEVELWRPWSPRPALRSATLDEDAEGAVMRVEGDTPPREIHLHPASVPLARWLLARAAPFGPVDVRHLLSPADLRASLPLLFALTRAGALVADPEELALASSLLG